LEALTALSFGHLSRFQFAGMNISLPIDGGLRTVLRLQNDGSDSPQSRPQGQISLFVMMRHMHAPYGWGWLHPLPSAEVMPCSAGTHPRHKFEVVRMGHVPAGYCSIRFHRRVEDGSEVAK
jgi:hypothetical protein